MVADTGKTLRTETIELNKPEAVAVVEGPTGLPVAIKTPQRQKVAAIEDRWRIDDEWWRAEPVERLYYVVMLASGVRMVVYKDLAGGGWYRQ